MKATCSAFQPKLEVLDKTIRMHALCVENCPITGQSASLGTKGYVDVFPGHLLCAGVYEPERWRPSAVNCPHGADPAWNGSSGDRKGTENSQDSTANAERPKEEKQVEDFFGEGVERVAQGDRQ